MRQAERDAGQWRDATSAEQERIKALKREVRQANEILRKASVCFGDGVFRPPTEAMIAFIEHQREFYGV
jgi:transposase-like protein